MYSTARDLLLLAKAHTEIPAHLRAAIHATLHARIPKDGDGYSMSWKTEDIEGDTIYYISGVIAGYTGFVGLDLRQKQAVVMLHNSFHWSDIPGYRLLVRLVRAQQYKQPDDMRGFSQPTTHLQESYVGPFGFSAPPRAHVAPEQAGRLFRRRSAGCGGTAGRQSLSAA
jgi:hypothetical protein